MTAAERAALLAAPPKSLGQVLAWMEESPVRPTDEQWKAARYLPPTTPLAEVLRFLGADPESMTGEVPEQEGI